MHQRTKRALEQGCEGPGWSGRGRLSASVGWNNILSTTPVIN